MANLQDVEGEEDTSQQTRVSLLCDNLAPQDETVQICEIQEMENFFLKFPVLAADGILFAILSLLST